MSWQTLKHRLRKAERRVLPHGPAVFLFNPRSQSPGQQAQMEGELEAARRAGRQTLTLRLALASHRMERTGVAAAHEENADG